MGYSEMATKKEGLCTRSLEHCFLKLKEEYEGLEQELGE